MAQVLVPVVVVEKEEVDRTLGIALVGRRYRADVS
jgi:hypothetical protein